MILVPEFIEPATLGAAIEKSTRKLGPPRESLRLESYNEGPLLQILHVGSYDPRKTAPAKLKTILRQPVKGGRKQG